ncbi:MAG: hypothetical protein JWQ21_2391 [Herminiimonas sp.]|nr:hypothetical protein [Herminiimonas sp.]
MAGKELKIGASPVLADESRFREDVVLIKGKLFPTQLSPHLLPMPRLEQKIDKVSIPRLTSLIAPAGYGKTTSLTTQRSLVESKGMRTGWVNLDSDDNDPIRFLRYVISALQRAQPNLGRHALAQASHGVSSAEKAMLLSFCTDLTKIDDELALFLDDYHAIENKAVHGIMNWLILHTPRNLKIFIASRTHLPLNLSKLRIAEDINEINVQDLSLHLNETGAFVKVVSGREITDGQIKLLHGRTEGWLAGLQLASLALKEVSDATEFINTFSGNDYNITSYLGEIVLSQLPDKVSAFLMRTALFNRFSAEFCKVVLAESDAVQMIEWIKERNLFLIPLDRRHRWYRYHHLFADYLKERFIFPYPHETHRLYQAASVWLEQNGFIGEAVRYAFATRNYVRSADLIEKYTYHMVRQGDEQRTTVQGWLAELPESYLEQRPALKIVHIWSLMFSRDYLKADNELKKLERLAASPEMGASSLGLPRKTLSLRSQLCLLTDQLLLGRQKCEEWLALWKTSSHYEAGLVKAMLGYNAYITRYYDYTEALECFASARHSFQQCDSYYGIAWLDVLQMWVTLDQGNIVEVERILDQGYSRALEKLGARFHGSAQFALIRAQICYERNKLDEAERMLERAFLSADQHALTDSSLAADLTQARILWLRGNRNEADDFLAQSAATAKQLGLGRLLRTLTAERIHLHLKNGLTERALRIAHVLGFNATNIDGKVSRDLANDDIATRIVEIRLQLATNQTAKTHLVLRDLLAQARRHGCNTWMIRLLCLKAALQVKHGNRDEARRFLDEALLIGASRGQCRTFVDEGMLIQQLLQEIWERRMRLKTDDAGVAPREYLMYLLQAFDKASAPTSAPYRPPAADSPPVQDNAFSERELQILRLADSGLGNRDLAAQLFLSEATIKWHLHNVYVKLNVNNRSGAIARARELSLI